MAKNVGGIDRIIRAVVGIGLIYWAMTPTGPMLAGGIIGFIVLLTAIFGWCPAYLPFGIKTNKTK
ncbi:MAG: DUF2892 domain-containing protein [Thiobacillus sp.]|jgi:hypothetical protein